MVENERQNAALGWVLVGFVCSAVVGYLSEASLVWAGFAALIAVVAVIPPVAYRNVSAMLPWEVLLLAVLPLFGNVFATLSLTQSVATYLSVAALALIVAVELHVFTPVRMTPWVAVLFVVIATMATAGVLAIMQWLSDIYLGTTYIYLTPNPSDAEEQAALSMLMWDFVYATATGIAAGVIFDRYFRRVVPADIRLPDELQGEGVTR